MTSYVSIGCLTTVLLVLTGCGSRQESAEVPEAQPPTVAGTEAAAEAVPEEGAAAMMSQTEVDRAVAEASASVGKPHAPVEASVVGAPALQSGVPGKVLIEVRPGVAVDGLTVEVAGDAALAVVGQELFRFGALAAAQPVRIEVTVTPTSGGIGRLLALLTLETGGQRQVRPVALTFDVGGPAILQVPAEKPVVPPVKDATGELIHSMPAETTVGKE